MKETTIGYTCGTLFQADSTMNGMCFKDEEAFEKKTGVCYISEAGFDTDGVGDWQIRITPENIDRLIRDGGVSTYESMHSEVVELLHHYDIPIEEDFVHSVVEEVFNEIDWQCFQSHLLELDLDEEYAGWKVEQDKNK